MQPDEELAVSPALNSDRRDSSPSPVPSSPEPSDIDTPVPNKRKMIMSRMALAKTNKRRAEAARVHKASVSRRSSNDAWNAHEGRTFDRATLEKLAAQQGLKVVPMSPTSRERALGSSSANVSADMNTPVAGPSHKRVRSASPLPLSASAKARPSSSSAKALPPSSSAQPLPPSTPAVIESMLTLTPKRKLVRITSPPVSPTPGPSTPCPSRNTPLSLNAQTLNASKSSRALGRTPSTPKRARVPSDSPRAIDVVEDVVLATASEDDVSEREEEPTPTKLRRKKPAAKPPVKLATKLVSKSKTRKRYDRDYPKADHSPVRRRTKLHQVGANTRKSAPPQTLPRQLRPRLHFARRPVALRRPRRTVFFVTEASDGEDELSEEPKPALKSRKITERVRRGLLQRYNQRTMACLTAPAPVIATTTTPRHRRQTSESPDPDDLAVDDLLHDTEMHDSEALEAVDLCLAIPSQLAGRKRRNLPVDGSTGRNAQRTVLRAHELSWYEPEYRKHEAWRRELRDPARAGQRRKVRDMSHLAVKEAANQAAEAASREEEAEGWVDDALAADAEMEMDVADVVAPVEPFTQVAPTAQAGSDAHVGRIAEVVPLAHDSPVAQTGPAAHVGFVVQNDAPAPTSSEVVEDILSFEPPAPVQVIDEISQPSITERTHTFTPRPRRRRVHEHLDPVTAGRPAATPAYHARIGSRERRRATTTPPEEPVAGPSTPTHPSTPPGSSIPAADAGSRSPPPRYEFPFYEIVRTPVRAAHPAPPPVTRSRRGRAVSDPPDYTGPYNALSPAPPPPYNSITDRDTVIAPVFEQPTPASPPPARRRHTLDLDRQRESDGERHAPGTWPARRRSLSQEDVDMDEAERQQGGSTFASFVSRVFGGFWR